MTKEEKEKEYEVTFDVFFMTSECVKAKNKKEAIQKAKNLIRYGKGEELKLFEIEEL